MVTIVLIRPANRMIVGVIQRMTGGCRKLSPAGGGVKGGVVHGATDEWGWNITQDRVHIHDLHATMLHLLVLDHERLTYRYGGRDYRLTDVHGQVVKAIIK